MLLYSVVDIGCAAEWVQTVEKLLDNDPSIALISVIVPVMAEGERIRSFLHALQQIAGKWAYEVIVVDGEPSGSTVQFLPADWSQVQGILAPLGRGTQMNAGVQTATGDILLFLHADAQLPGGAFDQIHSLLASKTVVGGAFDLAIDSPRWILILISRIASWRSRLTRIPYGDQAIFMRRAVFDAVGGYPDSVIMEDVALMRKLKQQGYQIGFIGERVTVSARRWQQEGVWQCTFRNWVLITLYFAGVSVERLSRWYRPRSL